MEITKLLLENQHVALEPLEERHREGLRDPSDDPNVRRFLPFSRGFDNWFDWSLGKQAANESIYAVRQKATGQLVGSSRFLNIDRFHRRLEIGHTWYSPSVWAGVVNPSCKLLLLGTAFDDFGANRVELKCDARNERSRAAILRLGAVQEGILRAHMVMEDGFIRDSVMFSVIRAEWPSISEKLVARLLQAKAA